MKILTFLFAGIFLLVTFVLWGVPSTARSATVAELLQQIAQLQAQIANLQTQLAQLKQISPSASPSQFIFQRILQITDRDEEVIQLQKILKKEGLFCKTCGATGYFGYWTKAGLMNFQKRHGLPITGITDTITRTKLNQLSQQNSSSSLPPTATTPTPVPAPVATPADITRPSPSLSINGGQTTTSSPNVTLSLSCTDTSGIKDVRYANDGGVFDTEPFEPFSFTRSWALTSGDGVKTVRYQCRDNSANQNTSVVAQNIVLKTTSVSMPLPSSPPPPPTPAAPPNQILPPPPPPIGKVIILKEGYEGEFLFPDSGFPGRYGIQIDRFLQKFYQTYGDEYDFMVVDSTVDFVSNFSAYINNSDSGTGISTVQSPLSKRLRSFTVTTFYQEYSASKPQEISRMFLSVIVHEIGHHWCCGIKLDGQVTVGLHWFNNLDLFYGDPKYADILGYYHWIVEGSKEICVDGNSPNVIRKFSDLTLYLMGLIPPSEVKPIKLHTFEKMQGDSNAIADPSAAVSQPVADYNTRGPTCFEKHKFTGTKQITPQDIIQDNGERKPSYTDSQKKFNTAFVVIVPKNQEVDKGFVDHVNKYAEALPQAWAEATSFKSEMTISTRP